VRAKAQFEEASRSFKSQLAAELDAVHQDAETDASHELAGTSEPSGFSVSEQHTAGEARPRANLSCCGLLGRAHSQSSSIAILIIAISVWKAL
jgi:hypothetical protein